MKSVLIVVCALAVCAVVPRAGDRPKVSMVRVPHGGIQPEAVVNGGVLHLLYFAGDPQGGDLLYVKSPDFGASWSEPLRVNSEAGTALAIGTIRGGQLAIGRNGRVHVAWIGSSKAEARGPMNPESGKRGAPMLYSRLNDAGAGFEPERVVMTRTFGLDGGAIAADLAGNVYVAWYGKAPGAAAGEAGRHVWMAVSRNDGKEFAAEIAASSDSTGACGCCGLALFADSKGVVRGLYRSATENVHRDIYEVWSADQGRNFSERKLHTWDINACPMSTMSLGEGAGSVFGAWETGGQVYFEDLTGAGGTPVSAPGSVGGRKHARVAVGPEGQVMMVWTEGTGWQKGGSLAWQEFDRSGKVLAEHGSAPGVPTWSFGAVAARPGGFVILY
jgi:hypothetical protein